MIAEIANVLLPHSDLEKQDTNVSNSQTMKTMKMSLFSLQRGQKIVLSTLILLLLSVEGMDTILKFFNKTP